MSSLHLNKYNYLTLQKKLRRDFGGEILSCSEVYFTIEKNFLTENRIQSI